MTTARQREQILNEYGAWVEQKTLDGLDVTVEAYLEAVKAEENVALLGLAQQVIEKELRIDASPEAFREWLREQTKEEISER